MYTSFFLFFIGVVMIFGHKKLIGVEIIDTPTYGKNYSYVGQVLHCSDYAPTSRKLATYKRGDIINTISLWDEYIIVCPD